MIPNKSFAGALRGDIKGFAFLEKPFGKSSLKKVTTTELHDFALTLYNLICKIEDMEFVSSDPGIHLTAAERSGYEMSLVHSRSTGIIEAMNC